MVNHHLKVADSGSCDLEVLPFIGLALAAAQPARIVMGTAPSASNPQSWAGQSHPILLNLS